MNYFCSYDGMDESAQALYERTYAEVERWRALLDRVGDETRGLYDLLEEAWESGIADVEDLAVEAKEQAVATAIAATVENLLTHEECRALWERLLRQAGGART